MALDHPHQRCADGGACSAILTISIVKTNPPAKFSGPAQSAKKMCLGLKCRNHRFAKGYGEPSVAASGGCVNWHADCFLITSARETTNPRNRGPSPKANVRREELPGSATQGPTPVGLGYSTPLGTEPRQKTYRPSLLKLPFPPHPSSPGGMLFSIARHAATSRISCSCSNKPAHAHSPKSAHLRQR
jgi:hypothetical protein